MVDPGPRHPFAVRPVLALAAAVVLGLLVLAPAYGFHRDELYFIVAGRHPALGYDDQPPFTPLVSAAAVALLGTEPLAVRILPALAMAAIVILTALVARELGGTGRAQALAAVVAGTSGYLAAGHLDSTATFDLLAWATVLWLVARILRGEDPRTWLLVGAVAGIGLLNKHLVLFLAGGLAVGLVLHRRDVLRTRWPWLAAGLALLVWSPNVAWQVANGLPQLEMARKIASGDDGGPVELLVQILLLAGPILFPVTLVGLGRLYRAADLRPFRALATTFVAILAVVLVAGGKSYYVVGSLPPLMAAGAIGVDGWLGRSIARAVAFGAAAIASLVLVALLTLPVLPASTLADTPIPDLYAESVEQIGWPELAGAVDGVLADLPPEERAGAAVFTTNYGELGAIDLLGTGLAPVYSGHNSAWSWGPPPDRRDLAVLVGHWDAPSWGRWFGGCEPAAIVDNEARAPNEERGASVVVCRRLLRPWSELWPELHHLD